MTAPNIDEPALIACMYTLGAKIFGKAQTVLVQSSLSSVYFRIGLGHTRTFVIQARQLEKLADQAAEIIYKAAIGRRRGLLTQLWDAYSYSLRQKQSDIDRLEKQQFQQLSDIMAIALQAALERILLALLETEPDSGLITATVQFIFIELPHLRPVVANQNDQQEEESNETPWR